MVFGGTLPSNAARTELQDAALSSFGASGFRESLEISRKVRDADPKWMEIAEKALIWGRIAPLELSGRTMILRGALPSAAKKSERTEYVRRTLGDGWKVVDEMTVGAETSESAGK